MKFHTTPAEESSSLITDHCSLGTSTFHFRHYQKDDLARSAIHDGAVIAWDPGLGKTMAIFAWPFLKRAQRVLIIAPASLHQQIIAEGLAKFGTTVTPIPDQAAALQLMRDGRLPLPGSSSSLESSSLASCVLPTFFLTDYRWLGYNGGDEWATGEHGDEDFPVTDVQRRRRLAVIARHFGLTGLDLTLVEKQIANLNKTCRAHELLGVPADAQRSAIKAAYRQLARLTHPDLHPEDPTATARMQRLNQALDSMLHGDAKAIVKGLDDEVKEARPTIDALMSGIGHTKRYPVSSSLESSSLESCVSIKCVFEPTLSTLLADCFDCAVADEAVRLKSGTTYIASGVLNLRTRYRLALTGTPIKNRLPDIFFLGSWVSGSHDEATARWPYGNTTAHQSAFAGHHLVIEENLTKQQKSREAGTFRRYVKQTNKITNVHRLWKLLGPVVIRRRKDQVGNDIVPKIVKPIRVLPGTAQQATYKWHIDNPPECATPVAAIGAQLQCLRQAALCPWSASLSRNGIAASRSSHQWSPKMLAILHLAADLMEQGQQLVVFSPFQQFSTTLKTLLGEAGVPSLLLDGRVKNTKRGHLAADFKAGKYPVLIAGIDAMGEGHSFECASHLVIPSLSWAYDANRQAIERVHRLTSRKDVTIYLMITSNSIDERLAAIFQEKGDASDLALDGRLFEEDKQEVSLAELIRSATLDFDPHATTLDERTLAAEWDSTLRNRLATAAKHYTLQHGTASSPPSGCGVSPQAVSAASRRESITKPTPERSHTPTAQPDFLTAMEPTPPSSTPSVTPSPTPPIPPSSSTPPDNIIPFPAKSISRTPEQVKRILALID
jgi:hypothetical protein